MASPKFDDVFEFRFDHNWALRNILVNYFVFERRHGHNLDFNQLLQLRKFLVNNAVFTQNEYNGIERMLIIEEIFESIPVTNSRDEDYKEEIGVPKKEHIELYRKLIEKEYGLSEPVPEIDDTYIVDVLWHVYHNENESGHKPGHDYMARFVMKQFQSIFAGAPLDFKRSEFRKLDYLTLEWGNGWKWPITFRAGSRILNDENFPYRISQSFRNRGGWDPRKEFPTICGSYFADDIKEAARDCDVQLVQLSSILKLIQWIKRKQKEGYPSVSILEQMHLVLKVNKESVEVPLSVGMGTRAMESKLRR